LVDDKSDPWNVILDRIISTFSNIPWMQGPLGVLRFAVTKIYVPLMGVKTNLDLNNGKGCGPGCDGGLKNGLATKMAAGEEAIKREMDSIAETMNNLTKTLKENSSSPIINAHGQHYVFGDPQGVPSQIPYVKHENTYHSFPMNLRPSDSLRNKLRVTTEGNCQVVTYHPPPQSHLGNLMMNIQNNLMITSGNNGMDFMSTGEIAMKGGSVHINGSQGEVSLTSSNLTTIGGSNVLISADPKTGESGVCIDSKHTYVRGSFNVNGDSAMLGSLTLDGALNVNYINCPSMRAPVTLNGTDSFMTHHANWSYGADALNASNLDLKVLNMACQLNLVATKYGITTLAMEAYNLAMMSLPIDIGLTPLGSTGIFYGLDSYGGVCTGVIWNYPHNHTIPPMDHTHEADVPRGGYYKQASGAGQGRSCGNPSPTPAPTNGTWYSPGAKSWAGGCGGGGLFTKQRNEKYGINSDDAFNGGNFVTTTVTRNPDGSIYPAPDLSYRVAKDTGNHVPSLSSINC